jgi:hypothetical protein
MGSGRTRLANCLFGQARPSGGIVRVEGKRAEFSHPSEALKRGNPTDPLLKLEVCLGVKAEPERQRDDESSQENRVCPELYEPFLRGRYKEKDEKPD